MCTYVQHMYLYIVHGCVFLYRPCSSNTSRKTNAATHRIGQIAPTWRIASARRIAPTWHRSYMADRSYMAGRSYVAGCSYMADRTLQGGSLLHWWDRSHAGTLYGGSLLRGRSILWVGTICRRPTQVLKVGSTSTKEAWHRPIICMPCTP